MSLRYDSMDLGELGLGSGDSRVLDIDAVIDSFSAGGLGYRVVSEKIAVKLDVSRTLSGWVFRIRYVADVAGPCSRCLKEAPKQIHVDAREIDQPEEDEELTSPYVDNESLGISRWVNDALVLAMPSKILCKRDCLGLCSVCGADLNSADPEQHSHDEGGDSRWAKLKQYKFK